MKMRTITCFGYQTNGTFFIIGSISLTKITRSQGRDRYVNVNVNVFNSVTSPRQCLPVGFNFNSVTFGLLKPQVGGIKIVTV